MSNSAFHSDQDPTDGIHVLQNWVYADATNRMTHVPSQGSAAALVAADVGKVCVQVDNLTWYVLTNHSPITWAQLAFTASQGDVNGPASSVDNQLAVFNGVTGKLLKVSAITATPGGSLNVSGGQIILPQSANPTDTAEGAIQWDTNDDVLKIGTGSGTVSIGAADMRDVLILDHFIVGSPGDADEFGIMGWRTTVTGTGANLFVGTPEAGHPGIARLEAGTGAVARAALHLGDATVGGNFLLNAAQQTIRTEFLVKFTGSVAAVDLEFFLGGWGQQNHVAGEHTDGIYVKLDPALGPELRLVAANGGVRTLSAGTTVIALNTWYRVGIVITFPGGVPTAQMRIDGVNEGAAITTNIPAGAVGFGFKMEAGAAVATESVALLDYVIVDQVTDKP